MKDESWDWWRGSYYLTDDNEERECRSKEDVLKAEEQRKAGRWRVGDDTIDGVRVSTVFLCRDHAFDNGGPILWETMVFGGPHDGWGTRYWCHSYAVAGHARALAAIKAGQDPRDYELGAGAHRGPGGDGT